MRDFKKYDVWQDSMKLVKEIYQLTRSFSIQEQYGLSNQLQRAVTSIPSNIAEGAGRLSVKDFAYFVSIALGSAYEVETQLIVAHNLGYGEETVVETLIKNVEIIQKQLNLLIKNLNQK